MNNTRNIVYPSAPVACMKIDTAGGLLVQLLDATWVYVNTNAFAPGLEHPIWVLAVDLTMSTAKGIRLYSNGPDGRLVLVGGPWDGERDGVDPGPRPGTYRDGSTFRGQPIDWEKADDEDDGTLEGPGVIRNA